MITQEQLHFAKQNYPPGTQFKPLFGSHNKLTVVYNSHQICHHSSSNSVICLQVLEEIDTDGNLAAIYCNTTKKWSEIIGPVIKIYELWN